MLNCPLCTDKNTKAYHNDTIRNYYKCYNCQLVFVAPEHRYSSQDEKKIYDQHENNPHDQAYRKHLAKLATPLLKQLKPQSRGLDFGSGPGPTLSIMLAELGHDMSIYDPFYSGDKSVLAPNEPYDFITMSEVIEHIYKPDEDIAMLWGILKVGGYLGIMTGLVQNPEHFKTWHYTRDPTHVCFFSKATFSWLAKHLGAEVSFPADNVVIFAK